MNSKTQTHEEETSFWKSLRLQVFEFKTVGDLFRVTNSRCRRPVSRRSRSRDFETGRLVGSLFGLKGEEAETRQISKRGDVHAASREDEPFELEAFRQR